MFLALSHNLPQLVKAIIRPPRAEYDVLELGPERFEYGGVLHVREDSHFINARGLKLQCSMWRRADLDGPAPCVVYSHGNASCRAEALQILAPVLASGASVFSFDFAGCGQSEGEYISLGWYEKDDLQAAVEQLRSSGLVSGIVLWGRSMGAVSAVFQASRDPSLAGMILDSPFASLEQVALELVTSAPETVPGAPSVPPFLVKTALHVVAGSVKKRAAFDLYKLRPIDAARTCFVPALFGCAFDDVLVRPHHSQQIFDEYAGDKNVVKFDGDHNDLRPGFFIDSCCIFLKQVRRPRSRLSLLRLHQRLFIAERAHTAAWSDSMSLNPPWPASRAHPQKPSRVHRSACGSTFFLPFFHVPCLHALMCLYACSMRVWCIPSRSMLWPCRMTQVLLISDSCSLTVPTDADGRPLPLGQALRAQARAAAHSASAGGPLSRIPTGMEPADILSMLGRADTRQAASSLSEPQTSADGGGSGPGAIEQIEEQLLRQAIAASLEAVSYGCANGDTHGHGAVERPATPPQLPPAPLDVVAALAATPTSAAQHTKDRKSAPSSATVPLLPGGSSEGQRSGGESALFGDEPLPARLNGPEGASSGGDEEEQLMLETAIRMSLLEVAANEASTPDTAPATAADLPPDFASAPAQTQTAPPDFAPVVD